MFDYVDAMTSSPAVAPSARGLHPEARERLAALAPRLTTGPLAAERVVAVHPALATLLPHGLARGATVRTSGHAALSTALLLAAGASQAGAWTGVAGVPELGLRACAETGVALDRLLAVREPVPPSATAGAGPTASAAFSDDTWGQVLGALVDGFDVVVFGAAARVRAGTARRIQSRLAHRGAVLLVVGAAGAFSADVVVDTRASWEGLGAGHGHLRARRVEVSVDGRRVRRAQRDVLWFPGPEGRIERTGAPPPASLPLRRTG